MSDVAARCDSKEVLIKMRQTANSSLECIKQLLPNLAASGIWAPLALLGNPWGVPLAIGIGCVAAYIGLSRICGLKADDDEQQDLRTALEIIRGGSENAEQELEAIGYRLQYNFENVHLRLTGVDAAIDGLTLKIAGRLDRIDLVLREYFTAHQDRFDDLCFFFQINFDRLRPFIAALPADLEDFRRDVVRASKHSSQLNARSTGYWKCSSKISSA